MPNISTLTKAVYSVMAPIAAIGLGFTLAARQFKEFRGAVDIAG